MKKKESFSISYIEEISKDKIDIILSLINNQQLSFQLTVNTDIYEKDFNFYNFNSYNFFHDLSPEQIYIQLKLNLIPENIRKEQEEKKYLKISILIKENFTKENFTFDIYSNKEKIKIIKEHYKNKRLFCCLCQEYTFINKLYKSSDDVDNKILVKYYCSESHRDHYQNLIDFLFNCCNEEFYEDFFSYRDGQRMKLTTEELTIIKNKFESIKNDIIKSSKLIKDKILNSITDINNLTEFQKKLYEKFERYFKINLFYNELLFYFIQMNINTYEQAFNKYHSQAIICSLRNFTDFIHYDTDKELQNFQIQNDINKNLLNGIKYFKNNFIIKIYEPEIDLNKIKNITNISINNDNITCIKYLNKYNTLILGSMDGKIYCFNLDANKIFLQIQAHKEEEENVGNWGILYINEISENRLITCCEDGSMKLWEIIDKKSDDENNNNNINIKYINRIKGHKDMVRKVIELKRGQNINNKNIKLVTCSFDCCLGFWEEKSNNNFQLLKLIKSHKYWINEIYEIFDGRIFAIGGEQDPILKIWNPIYYSSESIEEPIYSVNHDTIIEINTDFYIFGGSHTYIYLFRLSGKMMIRVIYIEDMYINSLILLSDGNLFADSGKNKVKYVDLGNYKVKDSLTTDSKKKVISIMTSLDNKRFLTCDGQYVKLWEY